MRVPTPLTPDRWPVVPAKSLFERARRVPRETDGIVTAFRDGEVTLRSNRRTEGFTNAIQEFGYQGVRRGDLVIHSMDGFAGAIGVSDSDGKASPVVHCHAPVQGVDARFYAYLLRRLANGQFITSLAKGIRERSTAFDAETFLALLLPAPPPDTQRAIADFLDTETARIDALVAKKRRMIGLLDEYRRSYIASAVTVGPHPGQAVAQTQHPFAPQIASGWRLMRLRHVVSDIVDAAHKTAPVVEDGKYLIVRTANVKSGRLVVEGAHFTDHASWLEWTARGVPEPGDVILTREAPAGEACLVPPGVSLCIGQRTVLLRPRHDLVSGAWLLNSLYSGPAQQFIEVLSRSTTVAHINMADIPDIPIVVPPLVVQERVLRAIAAVTQRCGATTQRLSQQIVLLREHRQAIVTGALTGEIEVPGVAA